MISLVSLIRHRVRPDEKWWLAASRNANNAVHTDKPSALRRDDTIMIFSMVARREV